MVTVNNHGRNLHIGQGKNIVERKDYDKTFEVFYKYWISLDY